MLATHTTMPCVCLRPPLAGKDEIDQLDKIFQIMSTPTPESWPGVDKLPK